MSLCGILVSNLWIQYFSLSSRGCVFFFYIGPPLDDFFSGHLLSPIFQSSYTHNILQVYAYTWKLLRFFLSPALWSLNPYIDLVWHPVLNAHHAYWVKHLKSCFFCDDSLWKMWDFSRTPCERVGVVYSLVWLYWRLFFGDFLGLNF